jgi:NADH-ubiquinone oxidoreductase chain 2
MLLTSSLFIILSNAVSVFNKTSLLYSRVTNLTLLTGCFLIYVGYNELELSLCGGLVHFNYTIQTFSFFILLVSALILNLTSYFPYVIKKDELVDNNLPIKKDALKIITNKEKYLNGIFKQFKITEYSVIILLVVIGATLLISSLDLVSIFLCIELQSYGLYILCTINKDSESSTAAGLTYFLLGSLASCLILLGQGFLYANTGNTNLENFQVITSLSDTSLFSNINYIFFYIQLSLVILSVGFLFKISASPFHF